MADFVRDEWVRRAPMPPGMPSIPVWDVIQYSCEMPVTKHGCTHYSGSHFLRMAWQGLANNRTLTRVKLPTTGKDLAKSRMENGSSCSFSRCYSHWYFIKFVETGNVIGFSYMTVDIAINQLTQSYNRIFTVDLYDVHLFDTRVYIDLRCM